MSVPILRQGRVLIASLQASSDDRDFIELRDDLLRMVSTVRAQGVVVDVTALDVLDSFASRSLRALAQMIKLRGAKTVIVGIQPDVAFAMVQLGLTLPDIPTALDLDEGLELLRSSRGSEGHD
jgi:rsbT antagonist protein RsbS